MTWQQLRDVEGLSTWLRRSWVAVWVGVVGAGLAGAAEPKVDYNRDIRPILSDSCFACHGPDPKTRKGDLRLDLADDVFRDRDGFAAVVPGDLESSLLFERVTFHDEPDYLMPPPSSGKQLSDAQIDLLRRWIEQGAEWKEHWAFVTPEKPPIPQVSNPDWPRNPIDDFILARLDEEGLEPSPEADKITLLRRVTFDLTGLPPTPEEVEAFLADRAPDAYEKVVDRLLQSPRYGEHRARFWLDAARYGDTHGLHLDNYREMWPYRDWVIRAFNDNQPYDQFVIEQLAGDLLPEPSLDQQIATGFNRAHVTTNEGGSIVEEVYVRNVLDRVETTGTVFLGLTVGCAQCHDHKYDPITMENYYQIFAFFNSLDDNPMDGNAPKHPPIVQVPSPEQASRMAQITAEIAAVEARIREEVAKVEYDDAIDEDLTEFVERADFVWIDDALPAGASPHGQNTPGTDWPFVSGPDHPVHSGEVSVRLAAEGLNQHFFRDAQPPLNVGEGDTLFAYVFLDPTNPPRQLMLQWRTDNWKHRAYWGENLIDFGQDGTSERFHVGALPVTGKWVRLEVEAAQVGLEPGATVTGLAFTQHGGTAYWDSAGIETWTPQEGRAYDTLSSWIRDQRAVKGDGLPRDIRRIVERARSERSDDQKTKLRDYFITHAYSETRSTFDPLLQELARLDQQRQELDEQIPTTLVSHERAEPKPAFILERGEYDQKGEEVGRALPGFLPPLPEEAPNDRLGFALWLVDRNHPLTARVAVNRFWQQFFGTGLVKTAEDFGFQGDPPSHPELLDWLAVQFMTDDGWDIKRFLKRIVMSATYQQSSRLTPDRLAKDPANRLLSRGPRYRLDAEMLRDQALAVSGLLVEQLGGPSVKPPQPPGLWEAVGYTSSNTAKFQADTGPEKVHRRSLYTFWKRTSPPPQMSLFDAPSREACTVRRERTNTPLQALMLMNEPQYVEASRALAERIMRNGGETPGARLVSMFCRVTGRLPDSEELAELIAAYQDHLAAFTSDPEAAKQLIAVGEVPPDAALDSCELAAWTMIANLLLNLDEVINKG